MRKSRPATVFFAVMTAFVMVFACAAAEGSNYPTFRDALRFAQENKPQEMDLGTVKYTAKYLWQIRNALPEDAVLHFTTTGYGDPVTEETTDLLISKRIRTSIDEIEWLIQLCPNLKTIDVTDHYYLGNKGMIELVEKYPEIDPAHTLYIDDMPRNCEAGKAAGFITLHLPKNGPIADYIEFKDN